MGLWQDIFGESKREVWQRLAAQLGGAFVEGRWAHPDEVRAQLGGFDIVLDTYTVSTGKSSQTFTRMRAPFVNARGLRFHVHRASIFSGIGKAFGQQDIEIGDAAFDADFVIQGNDVDKVKNVLGDPTLRALLMAQPRMRVEIKDDEGMFGRDYASGVDVLHFIESGVIRDDRRLAQLFSLFAALLQAFARDSSFFLEAPPAELPAAFQRMVEHVVEGWGGDVERVGDVVEARLDDARGVVGPAALRVAIPALPALTTHIDLRAPLPASNAVFTVDKRGLLDVGDLKVGDLELDAAVVIRGRSEAAGAVAAVARALKTLAPYAPKLDARADALHLELALAAAAAPAALGATLDAWQELVRARTTS